MTSNSSSLLGICIPTYKRPEHLIACVRSIAVSAGERPIPVFIADDSGDETNTEALRRIRDFYPCLFYRRNVSNLGIDRNILGVVDQCTCPYAWLLGEDDRLVPHAIPTVLKMLSREPDAPPFVFVNYRSVNDDFSLVLKERVLPLSMDQVVTTERFLQEQAWAAGFIGACIVRRDLWGGVNQAPYLDTYFAHVGVILEYLHKRQVYCVAQPLVLNRCGAAEIFSWKQHTFEVVGGWERLMQILTPLYGNEGCRTSTRAFSRAHGIHSLKFLMYLRADEAFDRDTYFQYLHHSVHSARYKQLAKALASCPPMVFKTARGILTALRRVRSQILFR